MTPPRRSSSMSGALVPVTMAGASSESFLFTAARNRCLKASRQRPLVTVPLEESGELPVAVTAAPDQIEALLGGGEGGANEPSRVAATAEASRSHRLRSPAELEYREGNRRHRRPIRGGGSEPRVRGAAPVAPSDRQRRTAWPPQRQELEMTCPIPIRCCWTSWASCLSVGGKRCATHVETCGRCLAARRRPIAPND